MKKKKPLKKKPIKSDEEVKTMGGDFEDGGVQDQHPKDPPGTKK